MKRLVPTIPFLAVTAFVATLFVAGCSNTPVSSTDPAPTGFILKENGAQLVTQAGTTAGVSGRIEINRKAGTGSATTPSGDLDIAFTNSDGSQWVTETQDSIEISGYDDAIVAVQRDPSNKWRFKLLAKGGGETAFNFVYFRGAKLLFTSHAIPVSIVSEGLDIAKMRILIPPTNIVNVSDTVVGKISAAYGTEALPINIDFFNARNDVLDVLSDPNVTLTWTIADTSVMDIMQDQFDKTIFSMLAKKAGTTTASFTLKHDSPTIGKYTAFASPDIDVVIH